MGQKVNPHGARVGVIFGWSTRWYADKKDFANNLVEDFKLRKMIKEKYYAAGISRIDIERTAKDVTVNIMTSKPGMIIGPKGATIEQLKAEVTKQLGRPAQINVMEIKQPDADAQLVEAKVQEKLLGFVYHAKLFFGDGLSVYKSRRQTGEGLFLPGWKAKIFGKGANVFFI